MDGILSSELDFALSMRCWVYPFCYLPPEKERCKRIEASGFNCLHCQYQINNKEKAEKIQRLYEEAMLKKEKSHYDFLKTSSWKNTIRRQILKYDNNSCIICGKKEGKFHVHHILDFSGNQDLTPRNLVCLCDVCHSKLHPIFPIGLWRLGWPNLEKFKTELTVFYEMVKSTSNRNKSRLIAPLEHIMMHLCYICQFMEQCNYGIFIKKQIETTMQRYRNLSLSRNRRFICDLREGQKFITVEGKIVDLSEAKLVETRYGNTYLVKAIIEDETGKIPLCLFGIQSKGISKGDFVRIEKGYVAGYEGEVYLGIPKDYGKILINPTQSVPFSSQEFGTRN